MLSCHVVVKHLTQVLGLPSLLLCTWMLVRGHYMRQSFFCIGHHRELFART